MTNIDFIFFYSCFYCFIISEFFHILPESSHYILKCFLLEVSNIKLNSLIRFEFSFVLNEELGASFSIEEVVFFFNNKSFDHLYLEING